MNYALVANGCSFTDYCWPTWADYLGLLFPRYKNVGQAGSDNATIVRRQKNVLEENNVCVILWTGWNRHVMWNTEGMPVPKNPDNHWQYNYLRWDKNWLVNFYNPHERFYTSLDAIQTVDYQCKLVNCTAYHFSAFPWMLGEIEKNVHPQFENIFKDYNIANNYLLDQNLEDFKVENNFDIKLNTKYNQEDEHPSPLCHFYYMKNVILPRIKEIDISTIQDKLVAIESAAKKHQEHVLNGEADIDVELYYNWDPHEEFSQ